MTDTYVLVPGAGGQAWFWHLLAAELRGRGHEVVAVDLPAGDEQAGFAEYADAVVAATGERSGIVLVAQSLGGFTAPLVCERVDVALLVLLNAMVPRPGESAGEWWAATGLAQARAAQAQRDGHDVADLTEAFLHDLPPHVRAQVEAEEPDQSETPMAAPWPLDRWPEVATRCLHGRDDRFLPVEFQRRVVAERLGIPVDEMDGGHLVALSRPVELADRLEAYRLEQVISQQATEMSDGC